PPTSSPFLLVTAAATPSVDRLSLHDALPICRSRRARAAPRVAAAGPDPRPRRVRAARRAPRAGRRRRTPRRSPPVRRRTAACGRSEEHTSELQSRENLVCRLLLEKKKITGML